MDEGQIWVFQFAQHATTIPEHPKLKGFRVLLRSLIGRNAHVSKGVPAMEILTSDVNAHGNAIRLWEKIRKVNSHEYHESMITHGNPIVLIRNRDDSPDIFWLSLCSASSMRSSLALACSSLSSNSSPSYSNRLILFKI